MKTIPAPLLIFLAILGGYVMFFLVKDLNERLVVVSLGALVLIAGLVLVHGGLTGYDAPLDALIVILFIITVNPFLQLLFCRLFPV